MKLRVKLFARARDAVGADQVELELPDSARIADLRMLLAEKFPAMRPLGSSLLVAVGTDYADDEMPLSPDAEVACFPPVSGG